MNNFVFVDLYSQNVFLFSLCFFTKSACSAASKTKFSSNYTFLLVSIRKNKAYFLLNKWTKSACVAVIKFENGWKLTFPLFFIAENIDIFSPKHPFQKQHVPLHQK